MALTSTFKWLEFDEGGALVDPAEPGQLAAALAASEATDLVVISHGWKTDERGASELYEPLWANVEASLLASGGPAPSKIVLAGILWPSKPFQTDFDVAAAQKTDGGVLFIDAPAPDNDGDLPQEHVDMLVAGLTSLLGQQAGAGISAATQQALAGNGFDEATAQALMDALKKGVGLGGPSDSELDQDAAGLAGDPLTTLASLAPPPVLPLTGAVGGTLGLGDFLSNVIQGPRAAVGRILNQFTYYAMKARAGTVGEKLGLVLSAMPLTRPVRLHLIGHSFGARLVTAAAQTFTPQANLSLASLTLLQGAYSHNGLSSKFAGAQVGAFASVITDKAVKGPVVMTHTHNDSACTIAYPLASRLSRTVASALGDANDIFGAMGANGAQNLLPADYAADQALRKGKSAYDLTPGKVNRMLADACVSEHMDVTNADVGALVASVLHT